LEITLAADDAQTKTASIDILTYIVEFSPSVVRDYTLQQTSNTDEVSYVCRLLFKVGILKCFSVFVWPFVKIVGRDADHSPPSSAEDENE